MRVASRIPSWSLAALALSIAGCGVLEGLQGVALSKGEDFLPMFDGAKWTFDVKINGAKVRGEEWALSQVAGEGPVTANLTISRTVGTTTTVATPSSKLERRNDGFYLTEGSQAEQRILKLPVRVGDTWPGADDTFGDTFFTLGQLSFEYGDGDRQKTGQALRVDLKKFPSDEERQPIATKVRDRAVTYWFAPKVGFVRIVKSDPVGSPPKDWVEYEVTTWVDPPEPAAE
ncbi:MAG: hypothetical protein FJZ01_24465 [Candidatus Sericytochromatia bacterium]|nr:hypothetical protein [Candidatus Tanganyikabacteria bacterium]